MSSRETKIFLELDPELGDALLHAGIDLEAALRSEGIDASVGHEPLPSDAETGERERGMTMVILASAALVLSVGYAVARIIDSLGVRPRLARIEERVPALAEDGSLLRRKDGSPLFKRVTRFELVEPTTTHRNDTTEISFGGDGVVLKMSHSAAPSSSSPS